MIKTYKSVAMSTLGCRLNQYESDSIRASFIKEGYRLVSFKEKADAYIINSCTVTGKSDAKTRNYISRAKRLNPNAKLFLTGCYAETNKDILTKANSEDNNYFLIPNAKKYNLFNIVDKSLCNNEINKEAIDAIEDNYFDYYLGENALRTRNYLKIQDGCNERCSYCKIPDARGSAKSRLSSSVFKDIEKMLSLSIKEIILTGINIGDYVSLDGYNLTSLVNKLVSFEGDFRIHLSSIEPNKVSPSLIDMLNDKKLCKHVHIPLQSASNSILEKMQRHYTKEQYRSLVNRIRDVDKDINITTDIMIGFPGESEKDFDETYSFLEEFEPSYVHTFKYSIREGTMAASMKDMVNEDIKSKRSLLIRELSTKLNFAYRNRFMNRVLCVIPEKELDNGLYTGCTDYYIPVTYRDSHKDNEFKKVIIDDVRADSTFASLVDA